MAATVDQIYLLNTLTYLSKENVYSPQPGMSIGEFVQTIKNTPSLQNSLTDTFWSKEQIQSVCDQILNDSGLCEMEIAHASRTEGGADCFVVTTPDGAAESQAIVVMEGTMGGIEWYDDVDGGTYTDQADRVSTACQKECLDWFQSNEIQSIIKGHDKVTVSGHSKGGNKAKYLTFFDDSIDECISFDGQGFSDEFVNEYASEISRNQDKIVNYNNSKDYVNILLNDFGETHFVQGIETSNYPEHHSLFTLCESIPLDQHITQQDPLMREADLLLNGFLRTCSDEEKAAFVAIGGKLLVDALQVDDPRNGNYYELLFKENGAEVLLKFVGYAVKYAGYEIQERLLEYLREKYPLLSPMIDKWLENVENKGGMPNGNDISVRYDHIVLDTDTLQDITRKLRNLEDRLEHYADMINICSEECDDYHLFLKISLTINLLLAGVSRNFIDTPARVLNDINRDIRTLEREIDSLASRIKNIIVMFENNEQKIIARLPDDMEVATPWIK